jgi:hypothetical protein
MNGRDRKREYYWWNPQAKTLSSTSEFQLSSSYIGINQTFGTEALQTDSNKFELWVRFGEQLCLMCCYTMKIFHFRLQMADRAEGIYRFCIRNTPLMIWSTSLVTPSLLEVGNTREEFQVEITFRMNWHERELFTWLKLQLMFCKIILKCQTLPCWDIKIVALW